MQTSVVCKGKTVDADLSHVILAFEFCPACKQNGMTRLCPLLAWLVCTTAVPLSPESHEVHLGPEAQRIPRLLLRRARLEHDRQRHAHHHGDQRRPAFIHRGQRQRLAPQARSKLLRRLQLVNGLTMLGTLGFSLALFYLLCSSLRHPTRRLIVLSGSLFCAVLSFMGMKKLWKLGSLSHELGQLLSAARFLTLFWGLPMLNFQSTGREALALQNAAGHLIGFAGADFFAEVLQLLAPSSHAEYLFGVLSVQLLWVALTLMFSRLKIYDLQCMHVESSSFAVGFLLSVWVRFAVTGSTPGSHGQALTSTEIQWMGLATCLALGLCLLAGRLCGAQAAAPFQGAMAWLTETAIMTAAWLIFFLVQWLCWYGVTSGHSKLQALERLLAFLLQALASSAGALAFLGAWSTWAGNHLDSQLLRALALQVGHAWEVAIYTLAVEAPTTGHPAQQRYWQGALIIAFLLCGVLPGWYFYMVPKVQRVSGRSVEKPTTEAAEEAIPQADADEAVSTQRKISDLSERPETPPLPRPETRPRIPETGRLGSFLTFVMYMYL